MKQTAIACSQVAEQEVQMAIQNFDFRKKVISMVLRLSDNKFTCD